MRCGRPPGGPRSARSSARGARLTAISASARSCDVTSPIARRSSSDAHDRLGPDAALGRVGAVEDLVEQEQRRDRSARDVEHLPYALDLGVEARLAVLQRVLDADRRRHRQRREAQRDRAHGRAGQGQDRVDADRPQQRALAGHVGAGHDQHLALTVEGDVVAHGARNGEQRMSDAARLEQRAGLHELRDRDRPGSRTRTFPG